MCHTRNATFTGWLLGTTSKTDSKPVPPQEASVAAFTFGNTGAVLDLTTPQLSSELAELDTRIHVVEGLIDAHSQLERVNKALQFARDRQTALIALQHEPFGYTRQQANAILDMPMSWQSLEERQRLTAEHDDLVARRASLRERVSEVLALHWFG